MKGMKMVYIIASALILYTWTPASAQRWQWAQAGTGISVSSGVAADASGNAYVTGHFLGPLRLGSDSVHNSMGPYQEVYLAKYDSLGNTLWTKNMIGYADANGVATDAYGHVYIAGTFYSDTLIADGHALTDPIAGQSNAFVVKYDALGNVIWAKNLGGTNNDVAVGLCTDPAGNIYVTGSFTGDTLRVDGLTIPHVGNNDGFIIKLNSAGIAQWGRSFGAPVSVAASAICADASGNVFLTGSFSGSYLYTQGATLVSSPYTNNVFVVKFDSLGAVDWSRYAGASGINNTSATAALAADSAGDVYVTGYFLDTLWIGSTALRSAGYQNVFTAKYDASGNQLWVKTTGGGYATQTYGISVDPAGNAFISGYFQYDTLAFAGNVLTSFTGYENTFVAQYDPSGNEMWAIATATNNNDNTSVASSYANGNLYITGNFQSFDLTFGNHTLPASEQGFFLAKVDVSGVPPAGIANTTSAVGIKVFPNPSHGVFYIQGMTEGNSIEVYDLLGQKVYERDANVIDLSAKGKGLYFYKISDQSNIIAQGKLLIK